MCWARVLELSVGCFGRVLGRMRPRRLVRAKLRGLGGLEYSESRAQIFADFYTLFWRFSQKIWRFCAAFARILPCESNALYMSLIGGSVAEPLASARVRPPPDMLFNVADFSDFETTLQLRTGFSVEYARI